MPSELAAAWTLDPAIIFLNHGSFGATPRAVLEAQSRWRARMESDPVRFLSQELEGHLDAAGAGDTLRRGGCIGDTVRRAPHLVSSPRMISLNTIALIYISSRHASH